MNAFNLIIGIVTIVSFAININNLIPEYSGYINNISYILLGVVAGGLISYFNKSPIRVRRASSSKVFVYCFYFVTAVVLLLVILFKDGNEVEILGSIGVFIVITLFLLVPILRDNEVTISERVLLSKHYEKSKNYSEAIWHLRDAIDGLNDDDERKSSIKDKISELKSKQII